MNGLAAIALLLAVASSTTSALKCYSCATAKLREDFKSNPGFKEVFDRQPLNFTDQCNSDLTDVAVPGPAAGKYLESCPKGDTCLRFTFHHPTKDYDAVVRGCTQRVLLQEIADSVGVEELGCHKFSEEAFGTASLCTCNVEGCNGDNSSVFVSASLLLTLLLSITCMQFA